MLMTFISHQTQRNKFCEFILYFTSVSQIGKDWLNDSCLILLLTTRSRTEWKPELHQPVCLFELASCIADISIGNITNPRQRNSSAGLLAEWISISLYCPRGLSDCWLCRTWAIFFHIFACGIVEDLYSGSRNITSSLAVETEPSLKTTLVRRIAEGLS